MRFYSPFFGRADGSMMFYSVLAVAGVLLLLLSSGAKDEASSLSAAEQDTGKILALDESSGRAALEQRFASYEDDVVLDDEGNITSDSRRSSFEGRRIGGQGGNSFQGRSFDTNPYVGKRFAHGNEFVGVSAFDTGTNRNSSRPWFLQQQANSAQGARAVTSTNSRFSGENSNAARVANERGGQALSRPSNVETDVRRRVFTEPTVLSKEDYNRITLEDSNRLLGR